MLEGTRLGTTCTPFAQGAQGGAVLPDSGYDFLEGSGFVLEGLEEKGLDAKSYIQTMLRRTEGSSKEEQIIQKEQILAELQRVEKELQEKAHAQQQLPAGICEKVACPECGKVFRGAQGLRSHDCD